MNGVLTFLRDNRQRLDLASYAVPAHLTCVLITPRFRASSHVVFLILPQDQPNPVLVAKLPRLVGASRAIEREGANLRVIQAHRSTGLDSVPRVIALEAHNGRQMLLETALVGRAMDPRTVRRDPTGCCRAITGWLVDLQSGACRSTISEPGWFERLIERPLRYLSSAFPLSNQEERLLKQTWDLAASLRRARLPLVIEHGDLCHPNIILLKSGGVGVVDWELADVQGLPACDLFFFLTYVAFSVHEAQSSRDYTQAFHRAFCGHKAWAQRYVKDYADKLQLCPQVLTPLMVLAWVRYLAGLLARLDHTESLNGQVDPSTAAWLRTNRYYMLWQYAVTHVDELSWG